LQVFSPEVDMLFSEKGSIGILDCFQRCRPTDKTKAADVAEVEVLYDLLEEFVG
jgi:hypothetical protein